MCYYVNGSENKEREREKEEAKKGEAVEARELKDCSVRTRKECGSPGRT